MKRIISTLVVGLAMTMVCAAQQVGSVLPFSISPQPPVVTPVTQTGVLGSTTYCYWVVAITALGKSAPAGPVCTATANATLGASNFDTVNFLAPTSPLYTPTGYDILRTTSLTPPTGACACAVATNQASSPVNDQANGLGAYTVATFIATGTLNIPDITGGVPSIISCGATSGATANCTNTSTGNTTKMYYGAATLAANAQVITFGATNGGFTSATSYYCVANDVTTRANPVQAVPTTGTTMTITNTTGATDVIQWVCVGF